MEPHLSGLSDPLTMRARLGEALTALVLAEQAMTGATFGCHCLGGVGPFVLARCRGGHQVYEIRRLNTGHIPSISFPPKTSTVSLVVRRPWRIRGSRRVRFMYRTSDVNLHGCFIISSMEHIPWTHTHTHTTRKQASTLATCRWNPRGGRFVQLV